MRIIGGQFKGRRFYPPADRWPTRPTTDYAKEALFNILQNNFDFSQIRFLDLFGGTGNHSFEIISRGCTDVNYVDKFRPCVRFVHELAKTLEVTDALTIHLADVFRYIKKPQNPYDYIFAGPPYALRTIPNIPDLIFDNNLLKSGGLFILEHNHKVSFDHDPRRTELRTYGQCHFSMFKNAPDLT